MQQATKVQGNATVGQKVTYHDMANQDGFVYEVISTPADNTDPKFGWSKGYGLFSEAKGITYSDLRQSGWTFA
jgi:hypothetical protein